MRLLVVSCLSALSLVVACKGSSTNTGDDDGTADAPSISGDKFTVSWGTVNLPPGPNAENTQCVDVKLGNDTEIKVHQIHNVLSLGSHHVIVYKNDMDTVEKTTPYDCQPFTGALNASGMV